MEGFNIVMKGVLIAVIYFLPTVIAYFRGYKKLRALFTINLIAGWTIFVWFVLLSLVVNHGSLESFEESIRNPKKTKNEN